MNEGGISPPGSGGKGAAVWAAEAAAASAMLPPFALGMLAAGEGAGACGGSDTMSSNLEVAASNLWKTCVSCRRDIWRTAVA